MVHVKSSFSFLKTFHLTIVFSSFSIFIFLFCLFVFFILIMKTHSK